MLQALTVAYTIFAGVISAGAPAQLRLGMDVNKPPYAFKNKVTGELEGFGKDVAMGLNALCPTELNITVVQTGRTAGAVQVEGPLGPNSPTEALMAA